MNVMMFEPDPDKPFERRFSVVTQDKNVGPKAVIESPGLPQLDSVDDSKYGPTQLVSIEASQTDHPLVWNVTARYELTETNA